MTRISGAGRQLIEKERAGVQPPQVCLLPTAWRNADLRHPCRGSGRRNSVAPAGSLRIPEPIAGAPRCADAYTVGFVSIPSDALIRLRGLVSEGCAMGLRLRKSAADTPIPSDVDVTPGRHVRPAHETTQSRGYWG
jgi:hypothetical protein